MKDSIRGQVAGSRGKIKKVVISTFTLFIAYSLQLTASCAETDISVIEKPFMEGQYEKAVSEAQRLINERSRQRHEVYYLKGSAELKLGRFKEARESFKAIISTYSQSNRAFDAYVGIGDSYLLEGNTESAIKAYGEAKEYFPSDKNIAVIDSRLNECRKKEGIVTQAEPKAASSEVSHRKTTSPSRLEVSRIEGTPKNYPPSWLHVATRAMSSCRWLQATVSTGSKLAGPNRGVRPRP